VKKISNQVVYLCLFKPKKEKKCIVVNFPDLLFFPNSYHRKKQQKLTWKRRINLSLNLYFPIMLSPQPGGIGFWWVQREICHPLSFSPYLSPKQSKITFLQYFANSLQIPSVQLPERAYFADACSETRPSLDPMIHCGLKPDNHGALNFLEEKKRKEKRGIINNSCTQPYQTWLLSLQCILNKLGIRQVYLIPN